MEKTHDLPQAWALENRDGLPDALATLLRDFPRDQWTEEPHFYGLVSFWLDRHIMFRRIMERMGRETEAVLDRKIDEDTFCRGLARLGSEFVNGLHGHHTIEDQHYFPVLARLETKIARGFSLLDKDHHAMDGLLAGFVADANEALTSKPKQRRDEIGRFHTGLMRLDRLLDRHLVDEEELCVPVILKHGPEGLH